MSLNFYALLWISIFVFSLILGIVIWKSNLERPLKFILNTLIIVVSFFYLLIDITLTLFNKNYLGAEKILCHERSQKTITNLIHGEIVYSWKDSCDRYAKYRRESSGWIKIK